MSRPRKAPGQGRAIAAARTRGVCWKVLEDSYDCDRKTLWREMKAHLRRRGVLEHKTRVLEHLGN